MFLLASISLIILFPIEIICLDEYIEESCYGDGQGDFLRPSCQPGEVLYIRDVYTIAKRLDTNCPEEATYFNRNDSLCCRFVNDSEDCGLRYFGRDFDHEHIHYTKCTGLTSCSGVKVAWNYTLLFCNQSEYLHRTNYMRQHYHCVPKNSTAEICNTTTLTGNPLYLWNDGYPASIGACDSTSGCTCTVQSTNNSPIRVDAFDIRFESNSNGSCLQRLHISEGTTESDINCEDFNGYMRKTVYTSSSSSFNIRLDNVADYAGGNFWIQLEATDNSSYLTLSCGQSAMIYNCSEETDFQSNTNNTISTTDGVSTIATGHNVNYTTSNNSPNVNSPSTNAGVTTNHIASTTQIIPPSTDDGSQSNSAQASSGQSDSDSSQTTALIIVIVFLALLLLASLVFVYTLWRKKKMAKVHSSTDDLFRYMPDAPQSTAPEGTANVKFQPGNLKPKPHLRKLHLPNKYQAIR